ncbi:hypothetical protein EAW52_10640 [Pseudomonas sp. LTJR-52]|uniref:hypothetical protein n=1 Tax=Pseudomonas sp. LTJR-52 TaxID=2479392 RepID=UPI000EFA47E5|nr:hypothetical protein [Pseudomonas sp. LTJR-52]AYN94384.1 hypothetical protein EAW52_10640 [Pseudomonas sp. LTJR-52]
MSEQFAEWLKREMPAGTVISDPEWWAPRILKAARTASAEPVAWVNGDELNNMLDDRSAVIAGKMDGYRKTPLYTAPDALQAEVERLKTEVSDYTKGYEEVLDENQRLREERDSYHRVGIKAMEERDALKADAERYRHIRENADTMHWENMLKADIETLEDIDAAIDAARTAKPEVDHE